MKAKTLISAVVLTVILSSCSSHCGIEKWRHRRYVQNENAHLKNTIKDNRKVIG
ncbi:MAG TPA: hypothetical protein VK623_01025 [Flavobacterium sp.]|nr:hypothetical protein [Flavobacterium sp.]